MNKYKPSLKLTPKRTPGLSRKAQEALTAARQGVGSTTPMAFDQWWDSVAPYNDDVDGGKYLAQKAWLAAIKYAEFNIKERFEEDCRFNEINT